MGYTDHDKLKSAIVEFLRENLKETRLQHTLRVVETAAAMAEAEGEDSCKAETAALLHDCARNISPEEMNRQIMQLGLGHRYIDNVNLAHSKIGAAFAREKFGIEDKDILDAVSYHTTGRKGMTKLEKIIFLADAIEPGRNYPGVDRIREAAADSLDRGCLEQLAGTIGFLKSRDKFIDEDTIEAFDDIKERLE